MGRMSFLTESVLLFGLTMVTFNRLVNTKKKNQTSLLTSYYKHDYLSRVGAYLKWVLFPAKFGAYSNKCCNFKKSFFL